MNDESDLNTILLKAMSDKNKYARIVCSEATLNFGTDTWKGGDLKMEAF